jgi:serine/threonine protein kinase
MLRFCSGEHQEETIQTSCNYTVEPFESYEDPAGLYILTEHCSESLFQRILTQPLYQNFSERHVARLFRCLLLAVQHLHFHDIVHLDINSESTSFIASPELIINSRQPQVYFSPRYSKAAHRQPVRLSTDNIYYCCTTDSSTEDRRQNRLLTNMAPRPVSEHSLDNDLRNFRLAHFGSARHVDANSNYLVSGGSFQFMSPQRLQCFKDMLSCNLKLDHASLEEQFENLTLSGLALKGDDMWACGVLLCQLVLGDFNVSELLKLLADRRDVGSEEKGSAQSPLEQSFRNLSTQLQHLIEMLLCTDLNARLTVDQALAHPWVNIPLLSSDSPLPVSVTESRARLLRSQMINRGISNFIKSLTAGDARHCLYAFARLSKPLWESLSANDLKSVLQPPQGGFSRPILTESSSSLLGELNDVISKGENLSFSAFALAACFMSKDYPYYPAHPPSMANFLQTLRNRGEAAISFETENSHKTR